MASASHTRQYFPQAAPGDKQLLFDGFVVTGRGDREVVAIRWPELQLEEGQLQLLEQLLEGVGYFGRAESWAELSVRATPSELPTNCSTESHPDSEPVRMLGAHSDVTWQQLTAQTSQLLKEGWSAPPGSRWLTYHRNKDCFLPKKARVRREPEIVALRYAYLRPLRPRRANTLFASETLRTDFLAILQKRVDSQTWESFAGKKRDGSGYLEGHCHPYILPQPSARQPHLLDEVVIYRKASFPEETLDVFVRELGIKQQISQRAFKVQFTELLDREALGKLPQFRASRVWESKTPYVQTRHLKPGKETLLDLLRRELINHGAAAELLSDVQQGPKVIDGLQLHEFRTQRRERQRPTAGVHNLRLEFTEPVAGPIVLGYGAHFGLGQFRPVD